MQWKWGSRRKKRLDEELREEVRELLDPYEDRTHIFEEPESDTGRVLFAPGLALSKLQERMEFVTLHPLDADVVIEDFLSFEEVAMMISGRCGGLLVSASAEHAADLLGREFPLELSSKPILKYDAREDGVDVSEELQERARRILNSQS